MTNTKDYQQIKHYRRAGSTSSPPSTLTKGNMRKYLLIKQYDKPNKIKFGKL